MQIFYFLYPFGFPKFGAIAAFVKNTTGTQGNKTKNGK